MRRGGGRRGAETERRGDRGDDQRLASPLRQRPPHDPGLLRGRPGFTLLELLVVTIVLGILAAIALPIYRGARERAATSALQTELRTLRNAQELYFVENDGYTDDLSRLDYTPGEDVDVEIRTASGGDVGWSGRLSHRNFDVRCAVFQGTVTAYDPATDEGTIACDGGS